MLSDDRIAPRVMLLYGPPQPADPAGGGDGVAGNQTSMMSPRISNSFGGGADDRMPDGSVMGQLR